MIAKIILTTESHNQFHYQVQRVMSQQIFDCDLIQSSIKSNTITTSTKFLKTGTMKYCPFKGLQESHK